MFWTEFWTFSATKFGSLIFFSKLAIVFSFDFRVKKTFEDVYTKKLIETPLIRTVYLFKCVSNSKS